MKRPSAFVVGFRRPRLSAFERRYLERVVGYIGEGRLWGVAFPKAGVRVPLRLFRRARQGGRLTPALVLAFRRALHLPDMRMPNEDAS